MQRCRLRGRRAALCSGPRTGWILTVDIRHTIRLLSVCAVSLQVGAIPRERGSLTGPRPWCSCAVVRCGRWRGVRAAPAGVGVEMKAVGPWQQLTSDIGHRQTAIGGNRELEVYPRCRGCLLSVISAPGSRCLHGAGEVRGGLCLCTTLHMSVNRCVDVKALAQAVHDPKGLALWMLKAMLCLGHGSRLCCHWRV